MLEVRRTSPACRRAECRIVAYGADLGPMPRGCRQVHVYRSGTSAETHSKISTIAPLASRSSVCG